MLRTLDIILIVIMTAVAAVTYTIKHQAELKLEEVRKLEAEIKLERDTIDLLRADWALLTQPSRLQKLITSYQGELQLVPTESTQLTQASELPMLKADLPVFDPADKDKDGKVSEKEAKAYAKKIVADTDDVADKIKTGSVKPE
ncbi:cell division protein FtsL [Rhizobium sp. LjRoot254]|uniref:cell division protein FtsL n=1 Tax=Rhizobium sp. LjRoot254 TaxID=3342297 RepID=UPI003ECD50C2